MFTGLIEEVGRVLSASAILPQTQRRPKAASTGRLSVLQIAAPGIARKVRPGDSVAVNGCCLTVSARRGGNLTFDLLNETLERTNLKTLRRNQEVNLERALATDGRIGGHFVQGHIDCVSPIVSFGKTGSDFRLDIELPKQFARYIAPKGSIAVNGISLTIAEISRKSFVVWIIPHTKKHTNLSQAYSGDLVNLEFDILAKYVERMLGKG
ncbi:MAG: riboflavin synthase [Chthoniobacterales bacterium]